MSLQFYGSKMHEHSTSPLAVPGDSDPGIAVVLAGIDHQQWSGSVARGVEEGDDERSARDRRHTSAGSSSAIRPSHIVIRFRAVKSTNDCAAPAPLLRRITGRCSFIYRVAPVSKQRGKHFAHCGVVVDHE